ncbi:ABC transporter permease subunit [Helicobacter rodentium]|uniref:ABC transporter permease subunit n=1 Tax=Helicobacter rodentium TaxID=59617 RepID=UPI0023540BA4|nr:ABC transporter permease subunit [Helicobacter rodentium]
MRRYILKRLLLIIPTLLGIMTLNFFIIQAAPGGPVEQMIARLEGIGTQGEVSSNSVYKNQGLDEAMLARINALYGFDKPILERYVLMLKNYLTFNFGESFYKNTKVVDLLIEKLPVSISLGLWSTLLIYLISIPLGIQKALREGSTFDSITSTMIIIGNAIPTFLFALILIILFAGGTYFNLFPLRGIVGDDFESLSLFGKIKDYFWHITLPVLSLSIGGFATLTLLSKNSFLEEIHKQYVKLAFAKGLNASQVLYRHIFRNAMLLIIASIPSALLGMLLSGSLLIEIIFSLDGLGLLGYESIITRDYPVIFGSLYIFTLLGLVITLLSDLLYTLVDPRINFQQV